MEYRFGWVEARVFKGTTYAIEPFGGVGCDVVYNKRFGNNLLNGHGGWQRFIRVLKDHLDAATEGFVVWADGCAIEDERSCGRCFEASKRVGQGGFATATFANNGKDFTRLDIKCEPINGLYPRWFFAEKPRGLSGKCDMEILDCERGHKHTSGRWFYVCVVFRRWQLVW